MQNLQVCTCYTYSYEFSKNRNQSHLLESFAFLLISAKMNQKFNPVFYLKCKSLVFHLQQISSVDTVSWVTMQKFDTLLVERIWCLIYTVGSTVLHLDTKILQIFWREKKINNASWSEASACCTYFCQQSLCYFKTGDKQIIFQTHLVFDWLLQSLNNFTAKFTCFLKKFTEIHRLWL